MKRTLIKLLGVGAVVAFVGSSVPVQAIPQVTGSITFSDEFTANGTPGDLNTATALTSITDVTVSETLGVYSLGSIVKGTPVSFAGVTPGTPFSFSPSSPFADFWTIVAGGTTYRFDVTDTTLVSHPNSTTLVLAGDGIAQIIGPNVLTSFGPTAATWNLSLNNNGGLLNFSGGATGAAAVPEGGTTVLLLGAALTVLGLAARAWPVTTQY